LILGGLKKNSSVTMEQPLAPYLYLSSKIVGVVIVGENQQKAGFYAMFVFFGAALGQN
jgi:hypothetical protein